MSDLQLAGFDEDRGFHFLLCPQDNVCLRKKGAHVYSEGTRVMPLVRAKVQVEEYGCACSAGALDREKCRASARFPAEVRSCTFKSAAFPQGGGQHIVDRQLD